LKIHKNFAAATDPLSNSYERNREWSAMSRIVSDGGYSLPEEHEDSSLQPTNGFWDRD
jgi:hypothetical protein